MVTSRRARSSRAASSRSRAARSATSSADAVAAASAIAASRRSRSAPSVAARAAARARASAAAAASRSAAVAPAVASATCRSVVASRSLMSAAVAAARLTSACTARTRSAAAAARTAASVRRRSASACRARHSARAPCRSPSRARRSATAAAAPVPRWSSAASSPATAPSSPASPPASSAPASSSAVICSRSPSSRSRSFSAATSSTSRACSRSSAAALGLAGQHGGAAAAGLREPVDGVDRRSRVRYDHLREARPERRRHRALEILRHTKHARQERRRPPRTADQARGSARAALVARLELAQGVGARAKLRRLRPRLLEDGELRGLLDAQPALQLAEALPLCPEAHPLSLQAPDRGARALARPRVGMQPLAEGALLVLQAPPASVEVVAPLAERLRQVAQPGLLGEGVEERVLALLDGLLEWRARPRERLDVRLGLGARRLALRQLRAQPIDLRPERRRLPRELREPGLDPLRLAAALDRARRELPAALGEPLRPRLGRRGREMLGRQLPLHGAQPLLVGRAGGVGLVAGAAATPDGLRRRGLLRLQGRQALAQGPDLGRPAPLADRHHA